MNLTMDRYYIEAQVSTYLEYIYNIIIPQMQTQNFPVPIRYGIKCTSLVEYMYEFKSNNEDYTCNTF